MRKLNGRRATYGLIVGVSMVGAAAAAPGCDGGQPPPGGGNDACVSTRDLFAEQVWPIINARCTGCHAPGGMAATGDNPKQRAAGFVLEWDAYPDFLDENLRQLSRMVTEQIGGVPKLLVKPVGGDTHVGGAAIEKDSEEYKLLEQLTQQIQDGSPDCGGEKANAFEGAGLDDWQRTFRRAAIVLGGRLPDAQEGQLADEAAFDKALDTLMSEPTFLKHVKESWNDVLLTDGGDRIQVGPFQFRLEDFPAMKTWQDGPDPVCAGAADYNACVYEYYVYWSTVSKAMLQEPLELISHVVETDAPFTEILTADYAMVNPYSAVAYNAQGEFDAPSTDNYDDWRELQVSGLERGAVPHAGVLTTPAFLGRWVSTETNKNRARSRVVHKAFLATDVLKLAQRPVDTSALTGVANATRNAASCNVCHNLVDPVATSFTNYSDSAGFDYDPAITAATNPHQEMLPPGFGTDRIPGQENQMLPALAEKIVADERFSLSAARVAYKGVLGLEVLRYPNDAADPAFKEKFEAWNAQDQFLHEVAVAFEASGYNYKEIVRAIVKSPFFRANATDKMNQALAAQVGAGRLLSPEILDRKIEAVAGIPWSVGGWAPYGDRIRDLRDRYSIFYGGIDSVAVTSRLLDANPLIVNVSERMANEVACRTVAWDFTRPADERALLPGVEIDTLPESGEAAIRDNIVYLFERALGEKHDPGDPEIEAAYGIFRETQKELADGGDPYHLAYECLGLWERTAAQTYPCNDAGTPEYVAACYDYDAPLPPERVIDQDPQYTIGAWMSVVSYVFSDVRFLYE
jgi:hypothetical protein